jgi:hypothetical protein
MFFHESIHKKSKELKYSDPLPTVGVMFMKNSVAGKARRALFMRHWSLGKLQLLLTLISV